MSPNKVGGRVMGPWELSGFSMDTKDDTFDCPYCAALAAKRQAAARARYVRSRPQGIRLKQCSTCDEFGHNSRTCPQNRSAGEE